MKNIIMTGLFYVLQVALCYGAIMLSLWITVTGANAIFNHGYSIEPNTSIIMLVATSIFVLIDKVLTHEISKVIKQFKSNNKD